jgi:hypothetical protein
MRGRDERYWQTFVYLKGPTPPTLRLPSEIHIYLSALVTYVLALSLNDHVQVSQTLIATQPPKEKNSLARPPQSLDLTATTCAGILDSSYTR